MPRERKELKIKYDKDTYLSIVETGRLVELAGDSPRNLSERGEAFNSGNLMSPVLTFSSKHVFDTGDLDKILKVHTPIEATAYSDHCKDNVLTVRFFKEK